MKPGARTLWAWAGLIALCVGASLLGQRLVLWIEQASGWQPGEIGAMIDGPVFLGLLAAYALMLAVPFVPGAELGLFLLMVFGAAAALPVYGATALALVLAFLVGRLVPLPRVVTGLRAVGLGRAADLVAARTDPLAAAAGISPAPGRLAALAMRHRCIALGILFNTPGNSLIGGGGGIALAVGASRLFGFPEFLATVLIATLPVPAAVLVTPWFFST